MLKAFAAFLLMFCVLSVLVQAYRLGDFFGGVALVVLAIDVLVSRYVREQAPSRLRETVL